MLNSLLPNRVNMKDQFTGFTICSSRLWCRVEGYLFFVVFEIICAVHWPNDNKYIGEIQLMYSRDKLHWPMQPVNHLLNGLNHCQIPPCSKNCEHRWDLFSKKVIRNNNPEGHYGQIVCTSPLTCAIVTERQ